MSATHGTADPLGRYYTPDQLACKLVGLLPLSSLGIVWEPHAGGGAFVRAVQQTAPDAYVIVGDIDENAPALEAQLGAEGACEDFLTATRSPVDLILGNPPFSGFERHIDHALTLAPRVAFLLRLAAMESAGRAAMWRRWPLRKVWVLAERPSFTGGGTDSAAYGFFWFERDYSGPAEVVPGWSWKGVSR